MYTVISRNPALHLRLRLGVVRRNVRAWLTSESAKSRARSRTASRPAARAIRGPIIAACGRIARRARNNISGAAAIEFAIVMSMFLVLALGVLAYGIYLGAAHGVSQLAADSARASVAGLNDTERAVIAKDHVALHVGDFLLLNLKKVTVEAAPSSNDVNQFQVVVRYDASDLPIWFMSGIVPLPSKTIVRSASIKRGGY